MEEEDRELLESLRLDINSILHVEDVLDYLRVRRILTANDDELIRSGRTRQYRCDLLLDTLPTRGATAFEAFVQALEFVTRDQQIDGYRQLIKKLKRRTTGYCSNATSDSEPDEDAELWANRRGNPNAASATSAGTQQARTSLPFATVSGSNVHVSCEQQICDLVEQRNLARDELDRLQRELARYEQLEKEYRELHTEYAQNEEDGKQRFLELRHALEQNYVFSRELDRVKAELTESTAEMDRVRRFQAEASASSDMSSKFRDLYTEVSVERDDLKKKLGTELASVAELQAKVETMRCEIEELRGAALDERQHNASLREQLKQADIEVKFQRENSMTWKSRLHEKERRSSSKELSDLTHEYKQRCEDLNLAAKEIKELRKQAEKTQEDLELANKVADETEQRCAAHARVLQELTEKYGAATNESRNYKTQLHHLTIELQELQKGKEDLQLQRAVLQQDNTQLEQQAQNVVELHEQWHNEMDQLQRHFEKMRQDRDQTKGLQLRDAQNGDMLKRKNSELQARLKQAEFNSKAARSELSEARRNGVFLEYQLHQLSSFVTELTDVAEENKTDQDRARLNLTLYRSSTASQNVEFLTETQIPAGHRLPIREIELNKSDDHGIGVTLEGHIVVAKSSHPVSQNYRDLLLPGDRILKVNGMSVRDQPLSAVEEFLQQGLGAARLLVHRSPTSFLMPTGPDVKDVPGVGHGGSLLSPVTCAVSSTNSSTSMPFAPRLLHSQSSPAPPSLSTSLTSTASQVQVQATPDSDPEESSKAPALIIQQQHQRKADKLSLSRVEMRGTQTLTSVWKQPPQVVAEGRAEGQYTSDRPFSLAIRPVSFYNMSLEEEEIGPTTADTFFRLRPATGRAATIPRAEPAPALEPARIRPKSSAVNRSLLRRSSSMSEFDRIISMMTLEEDNSSLSDSEEDRGERGDDLSVSGLAASKSFSSLQADPASHFRKRLTQEARRKLKKRQVKYSIDSSGTYRKSISFDHGQVASVSPRRPHRSRAVVLPKGSPLPSRKLQRQLHFSIEIVEHYLEDPSLRPTDRRVSLRNINSTLIPGSRIFNIPFSRVKSLKLQLAGGRGHGIFIEDIVKDGSALGDGKQLDLKPGDQLLRLGNCDLGNATFEMAATAWKLMHVASSLQQAEEGRFGEDRGFTITARDAQTAYKNLPGGVRDAFFMRITRAVDREYVKGELRLECDALYHVVNTMFEDKEGVWRAHRINDSGQVMETGCIPSASVVAMATRMPSQIPSPKKSLDLPVSTRLGTGVRQRSASTPMPPFFVLESMQPAGSRLSDVGTMPMMSPKQENSGGSSWVQKLKKELLKGRRTVPSPIDDSDSHTLGGTTTAAAGGRRARGSDSDISIQEPFIQPVYEVVERCKLVFARPIIIIGAMAVQLMHQLDNDPQSKNFLKCQAAAVPESTLAQQYRRNSGAVLDFVDTDGARQMISLHSVVELSKKQKHVVFANVDPSVLLTLQESFLHPIVVQTKVKSIDRLCYCLGVDKEKAMQALQAADALVMRHGCPADILELGTVSEGSPVCPLLGDLKTLVAQRQSESLWIASDEQLPTQPLGREDITDWLQDDAIGAWST